MTGDPLHRFEAEHTEALLILAGLEAAADGLAAGDDVPSRLKAAREAHQFLSTAVRRHNDNEETALFPLLREQGPVALFIEEHVALRKLEDQLLAAIDGPDPAGLLRAHIERENSVLFPMARVWLGEDGLAQVARHLPD